MLFELFAVAAAAALPADGLDVALPPEVAIHTPSDLRGYFLVFLVNPSKPKEMSADLFARHQAYIRKHVESGAIRLVGPVSGSDHIRGLKVINAASIEEARAIAEGDPAVQEKVMAVEVYGVTLPSLKELTIHYPPKR